MPVGKGVIVVFEVSGGENHLSGSEGLDFAALSLFLNFDMVVDVDDGSEFFDFDDIGFLHGIFVVDVLVEDSDDVDVLEGDEFLVVDKLEPFNVFVPLHVSDDFLGVVQVISRDFFPSIDVCLRNYLCVTEPASLPIGTWA